MLWSWAVPKGVPLLNKPNHLAVRTEDHPLEYLTFHGEIPQGPVRRGLDDDLGLGHLRGREDARRRGDRHAARRAGRRQVRPVPDQGQSVDDPPHEPARRSLARAGPARSPTDARDRGRGPAPRRGELGVRDEVGRHAGGARGRGRPAHAHLSARQRRHVALPRAARPRRCARRSTDAVLDGEIVALDDNGRPSFEQLQPRMQAGSASVSRRLAAERPDGLHDLRRALARRPLHVRAAVPRSAQAARAARARRARPGRHRRRRSATATR